MYIHIAYPVCKYISTLAGTKNATYVSAIAIVNLNSILHFVKYIQDIQTIID